LLASSGAGPTGNPNVPWRDNDKPAGPQLVSVFLQRFIEVFGLRLQLGPGHPKKQHARVCKALIENQLSEIAIGNDEDPLLLTGNRQDVLIRKAVRVIS
jgi:hypothetical protein